MNVLNLTQIERMITKRIIALVALLGILTACAQTPIPAEITPPEVKVVSAMRNIMWKGEIGASVMLDTLYSGGVWYGIGPMAELRGEITVLDGVVYTSQVDSMGSLFVRVADFSSPASSDSSAGSRAHYPDGAVRESEQNAVGAPFFVHCGEVDWVRYNLPESITSMEGVEAFLDAEFSHVEAPFPYMVKGFWDAVDLHAVNLPEGSSVSSPDEAHQGLTPYKIYDLDGTGLGFYSRKHQAVFTHHDTHMHTHFISENKRWMGHLDGAQFRADKLELWLPR